MPGVVWTFEFAVRPLAAVGQLGARRLELHEDFVRGAIKQFALLGEDQAARMAVEQRYGELAFQCRDLTRHRRLRQAESLAGMGERAGLGCGVKHLQLVPVHRLVGPAIGLFRRRTLMFVGGQEFLGFERGHAALAGGGHGLPVDLVGDVAGGEHAGHRGGGRLPLVTM